MYHNKRTFKIKSINNLYLNLFLHSDPVKVVFKQLQIYIILILHLSEPELGILSSYIWIYLRYNPYVSNIVHQPISGKGAGLWNQAPSGKKNKKSTIGSLCQVKLGLFVRFRELRYIDRLPNIRQSWELFQNRSSGDSRSGWTKLLQDVGRH